MYTREFLGLNKALRDLDKVSTDLEMPEATPALHQQYTKD